MDPYINPCLSWLLSPLVADQGASRPAMNSGEVVDQNPIHQTQGTSETRGSQESILSSSEGLAITVPTTTPAMFVAAHLPTITYFGIEIEDLQFA